MKLYKIFALLLLPLAVAQLAAVFDKAKRSSDCALWASWGPCLWTSRGRRRGSSLYLQQLAPTCRSHWFYKFVGREYGRALNNFFAYLSEVTIDSKPCGMCSYKQSCGFGGKNRCGASPFKVDRAFLPLNVAEALCCEADLGGGGQRHSCRAHYAQLRQGEKECQVWPSTKPKLTGIPTGMKQMLYDIQWSNCVVERWGDGSPRQCRCCCYPYTPNPHTFMCERIKGSNDPPIDQNSKCEY